jgi:Zn-dependent protease with chaperone function
MYKKILYDLNQKDYEHPLDRQTLNILEKTPGLPIVVKKFNEMFGDKILRIQYTGSNIKVTNNSFPQLNLMYEEICNVLNIDKRPDLYIRRDDEINAFTSGVENSIIVLNSGCIDKLNYDELTFILGHELGHVKSEHVLYKQMAYYLPYLGSMIGKLTFNIGEILSYGIQVALLNWDRASEFSADRAGLLACQNVDAPISCMMKLAGLPDKYFNSVSVESFLEQASEFEGLDEDSYNKVFKLMSTMGKSHPWTVMRAAELNKWRLSGEYEKIINNCQQYYKITDGKMVVYCNDCFGKMKVPKGMGKITATCPFCKKEIKVES